MRIFRYISGDRYHFYIRDYQGNNRVVFDQNGDVEQVNHYYPYGGTYGEGVGTNEVQPYKYGGKELDRMNGLDKYDFGARQLDSAKGGWDTMDPMLEKYYNISPYAYCNGNPILYIDPNGDEIWIIFKETINGNSVQQELQYKNGKLYDKNGGEYEGNNSYAKSVQNDLNQLSQDDKILQSRIDDLQNSDEIHSIENTDKKDSGNSNTPNSQILDKLGFSTGSKTKYNPDKSKTINGDKRAPRVGLAHELLGHGWDSDQGKTDYKKVDGISMYEINAINIENRARSATGNKIRTTFGKKIIPAKLLDNIHKNK